MFEPTRGKSGLDNLFTNLDTNAYKSSVNNPGISDHLAIISEFKLPSVFNAVHKPITCQIRYMHISAIESFKYELYDIDWDTIFQHSQYNCLFDTFFLYFNNILNVYFL